MPNTQLYTGGSIGSTSGSLNRVVNYVADNFSDLSVVATSPASDQLAYVRNSQGTKWLPGSLGGTYYPSGYYRYVGSTWVSDRNDILEQITHLDFGWADYSDSTYTSGSPLSVSSDTDTQLPNDGVNGVKTYEPDGVTLYDASGQVITGREGDGLIITIEFKVTPTGGGAATLIESWLDIGGAVGELYRRPFTFPKGSGVERTITFSTSGYTLDTWETNGAEVWIRANGTCDVYDIRYILVTTFRAL